MKKTIIISDLRGGRNGADPPISLPDNQAVEMLNVDNYKSLLCNKRGGAGEIEDSGGTAFSSGIQSIFRHVPGRVETDAEVWGIDGAATPIVKRMTGGSSFANVTMSDAIATLPYEVNFASFNGKLFMAYDSTVDRLHVYDPNLASPRCRRVGFTDPAAPTAANDGGAGTYAAILRYYRVRWIQISSSVVIRRSEPGASVSFTPNGNDTGVVVTQPSVPSEQETHWEVEVSLDNVTFYRLSQVAIATTTYTDSAATTTYQNNTLSADTGEYENWKSVRYLLTDQNRLLGAGSWETSGARHSRVWYSPVLGTTDEGDDERVITTAVQKNYIDLNENDGGAITGMGGPVYGAPFVFKRRQIWKLNPTGDNFRPYIPRRITDAYGCIAHKSIVSAIDHQGNSALYFLSMQGPCRIVIANGTQVVQYLGRDVEDIWEDINLTTSTIVGHGVYHADKHQVWFWIATGAATVPDVKIVFDVLLGRFMEGDRVRGGWYKHDGPSAGANCSTMGPASVGIVMAPNLKPLIGRSSGTQILTCDVDTGVAVTDAGTDFQAYVKTKPLTLGSHGQNHSVGQTVLVAQAATNVTITQTLDRNYGSETRTSTVSLTADGSETRVIRKFQASDLAQAAAIQVQLGDASAASTLTWALDAIEIPLNTQEVL